MAQSLDPLCTGKGEGEVQPSGLDAVVLPALGGRTINVVLLMEARVLTLVPTIGLRLNSRVKASWRNWSSAHSNSSKHHKNTTHGGQDFVDPCHGLIRVVGSLPNTCTISADFWTSWLLLGQQLEQFW